MAPKRRKANLPAGLTRGVLVTCSSPHPHAMRSGAREAMRFLQMARDDNSENLKEAETEDTEPDLSEDVSAALQSEIRGFAKDGRRFVPHDILKGVSFIRFMEAEDIPSVLVAKIFHMAKENSDIKCRFLSRIVPIDVTCLPYIAEFTTALQSSVAKYMPVGVGPATSSDDQERGTSKTDDKDITVTTWAVNFTRRSMKTLDRQEVFDACGGMVDSTKYKVDLTHPDISIVIEVNPLFCGFSIYRDCAVIHNFNLYRVTHPEEEDAIKAQALEAKKGTEEGDSACEQKDT